MKLITGGTGFIGSKLDEYLDDTLIVDTSHTHLSTKDIIIKDIRNIDAKFLKSFDIDTIYHLAGILGTHETFDYIVETESVNCIGTLNLLEEARKADVKNFLYMTKLNMGLNPYTLSKRHAQDYIEMYSKLYGLKYIIAIGYTVYGPRQPIEPYYKIMPMFITWTFNNLPMKIWGDGNQTINPIYIDDTAKIISILPFKNQTAHIGTDKTYSVNETARLIKEMVRSKSRIIRIPMRKGEDPGNDLTADISTIPKFEFTQFKDGLIPTIEYYKNYLLRVH